MGKDGHWDDIRHGKGEEAREEDRHRRPPAGGSKPTGLAEPSLVWSDLRRRNLLFVYLEDYRTVGTLFGRSYWK